MTVRSLWVQATPYNAVDDRALLAALLPPGAFGPIGSVVGLRATSDLVVTLTGSGSITVNVGRGAAFIVLNSSIYCLVNDTNVALPLAPADPTNGRIDIVVAQINDPEASGSVSMGEVKIIAGVAAPSPVAPAVPAGALLLNTLTVAAGSTAPVNTRNAQQAVPPVVIPPQRFVDYYRGNPQPVSLPAGGTLGFIGGVTVPPQPYDRRVQVHFRGLATAMAAGAFGDLILNLNNVLIARARTNGVGNPHGIFTTVQLANSASLWSVNVTSSGTSTWSSDGTFGGLDIFAHPLA